MRRIIVALIALAVGGVTSIATSEGLSAPLQGVDPAGAGQPPFDLVLALDGADAYASTCTTANVSACPDSPPLDLGIAQTDDFTIEAFFYVPDLANNTPDTLFWKQGAYAVYIVFSSTAADRVVFRIWTGPSSYNSIFYDLNLQMGWHHVAAVFDNEYAPAADLLALYLDGSQVAANGTDFEWTPGVPDSSSPVNVGAYAGVNPYAGALGAIRFSDVVRYSGPSYALPTAPFPGDADSRGLWHFATFKGNGYFPDDSGNGADLFGHGGALVANFAPTLPPTPAPGALPISPIGQGLAIDPDAGADSLGGRPAIAADGNSFFVVYLEGSVVAGSRVSHDGGILDPDGIGISTGAGYPAYPSVAFDGANYFVVWMKDNEIYGARVTSTGSVLDAPPIQLTTGAFSRDRPPAIAFDGTNYLIVWRTLADDLYAARVTTSGVNLDGPAGFQIGRGFYPWAAFDGTNYLVVWHDHGNALDIYGNRIAPDGTVLDGTGFVISNAEEDQDHASLAFDGTNYLVVWHDTRGGADVAFNDGTAYGARVSPGGAVLDSPAIQIADNVRSQTPVVVAFDGTDYLVAWQVDLFEFPKNRGVDVFGRRLSTGGTVLDESAIPIATSFGHQFGPRIAYDSGRYLVAWSELMNDYRCWFGCLYGQLLQKQATSSAASSPSPTQAPHALAGGGWTVEPSGSTMPLTAIWGSDSSHLYAVGAFGGGFFSGEFLAYDGSQWLAIPIDPARMYGVWGSAPNDVWAVGSCWTTLNYDGQTMYPLPFGCLDFNIGAGLWGTSNTNMLAAGSAGGIFHYDGGPGNVREAWRRVPSPVSVDLQDIWGTSSTNVYAVGEFGTIIRYDGAGWSQVAGVPSIQSLNSIWGSSADDVFAVGDSGTILHYDGGAWAAQDSGTTEHLFGVWGRGPSDVFAVGFNGTILHYDGAGWTAELSGTDLGLMDVWVGENSAWVVGDQGVILRRTLPDLPTPTLTATSTPTPTRTSTRTPTATPSRTPTATPQNLCGDVNDSQDVNSVDALLILQFVVGLTESLPNEASADVDGDGDVTSADALLVLQLDVGLIKDLGFC